MNLRLIVAEATVAGAVSLGGLLLGTGIAGADPVAPQLPAEQAAASNPDTSATEGQENEQQAGPVYDNGLSWPWDSLGLPPAPVDVPPPVQVTVPVGVSLGLPTIPLGLPLPPPPQLPPLPEVPLPRLPEVPLPPPPSIPLPPTPF